MTTLDAVIGKRIRDRRRDLGLTQSALGERLDMTGSNVSYLETGHIGLKLNMVQTVARALKMPATDLVRGIWR